MAMPSMIRVAVLIALLMSAFAVAEPLPRLKVSDNKRFLVTQDGKPFFYLGDTAWELLHRLNREDADVYLKNRAERGFNVIQTVALAERDGLTEPNPYGHVPLADRDPTKPNEEYFRHVDHIVDKANALGMYVGFLPTWGDKWNAKRRGGPEIFTPANAEHFGAFLGRRYKDKGVIWILGGDRLVEKEEHTLIMRAMAKGLRSGDGGAHLITFHPVGGRGSAEWYHAEEWLDFNMRQNGHGVDFNGRYDQNAIDYARVPTKPVFDGEPVYEDHPIAFRAAELGHSTAADCRRALYWNLFTGAFGHTYGHHSVWQMWDGKKHTPVNGPLMPWRDAIDQPGAAQMIHGRSLMESRPFLTRVPDDSVIVPADVSTRVPGAGMRRFVATRDEAGAYAMVYAPIAIPFSVRMDKIGGASVTGWWFNPRDGTSKRIGEFPNTGARAFTPPDHGELLDWVLVLDDASKQFATPGQAAR